MIKLLCANGTSVFVPPHRVLMVSDDTNANRKLCYVYLDAGNIRLACKMTGDEVASLMENCYVATLDASKGRAH